MQSSSTSDDCDVHDVDEASYSGPDKHAPSLPSPPPRIPIIWQLGQEISVERRHLLGSPSSETSRPFNGPNRWPSLP